MKELYTEIDIQAPPRTVWNILTDFDTFPEWNPFIRKVQGTMALGEQIEIYIQPPGKKGITFRPKILKVHANRELRWLGHMFVSGLFDGEHIFTIEKITENHVLFIQREVFKGLLVPLFARQLDMETRNGFIEMNQALKERAEALTPPDESEL